MIGKPAHQSLKAGHIAFNLQKKDLCLLSTKVSVIELKHASGLGKDKGLEEGTFYKRCEQLEDLIYSVVSEQKLALEFLPCEIL